MTAESKTACIACECEGDDEQWKANGCPHHTCHPSNPATSLLYALDEWLRTSENRSHLETAKWAIRWVGKFPDWASAEISGLIAENKRLTLQKEVDDNLFWEKVDECKRLREALNDFIEAFEGEHGADFWESPLGKKHVSLKLEGRKEPAPSEKVFERLVTHNNTSLWIGTNMSMPKGDQYRVFTEPGPRRVEYRPVIHEETGR